LNYLRAGKVSEMSENTNSDSPLEDDFEKDLDELDEDEDSSDEQREDS
jgi:hypothetical protein